MKNAEKAGLNDKLHNKFERLSLKDIIMIVYDLAVVTVAFFFALWIRFDCRYTEIPREYFGRIEKTKYCCS